MASHIMRSQRFEKDMNSDGFILMVTRRGLDVSPVTKCTSPLFYHCTFLQSLLISEKLLFTCPCSYFSYHQQLVTCGLYLRLTSIHWVELNIVDEARLVVLTLGYLEKY